MPNLLIATLFECVQFIIVRPAISVDFRVLVGLQYAPHRPLAVDETTIPYFQMFATQTAGTLKYSIIDVFHVI